MGRPVTPDGISRPVPDRTPVVSVWSNPNGLPMQSTRWPTWRDAEEPRTMGTRRGRGLGGVGAGAAAPPSTPAPSTTAPNTGPSATTSPSSSTAMSRSASWPTSLAANSAPEESVTRRSSAPRTTW